MEHLGIRFAVNDSGRFASLRSLFREVKRDKTAGDFREPQAWVSLVPEDVKASFAWPSSEERARWLAARHLTAISVPPPSAQIGSMWNFFSVFEALEDGEYDLLDCEMVGDGVAEMRVDPLAYPYGGLGPFIALAEAFGFEVLGVNECGEYETRETLLGRDEPA